MMGQMKRETVGENKKRCRRRNIQEEAKGKTDRKEAIKKL